MAFEDFAVFRISFSDGGTISSFEQRFRTFGLGVQDLSDAWELIGERLEADNMLQMVSQGGVFPGGAWPPLAPRTIEQRVKQGYGEGPIEWRTGVLARSLAERGSMGHVFDVGPDHVTVGTDVEYAGFQHFGTRRIPARNLVGLTWQTRSYALKVIADTVLEKARAAGLETYED